MPKNIVINRIPVESSHVKSAGYDSPNRILEVEFVKPQGTVWRYSPVTAEAWKDLQLSDSIGKWIHQNIKGNSTIDAVQIS